MQEAATDTKKLSNLRLQFHSAVIGAATLPAFAGLLWGGTALLVASGFAPLIAFSLATAPAILTDIFLTVAAKKATNYPEKRLKMLGLMAGGLLASTGTLVTQQAGYSHADNEPSLLERVTADALKPAHINPQLPLR
jgi:hypothetical protein